MSKKKQSSIEFDETTGEVLTVTPTRKPDIRTFYNPHRPGDTRRYEFNDQPSLTIPDETMSVAEILDRYARGLPLGGSRVPVYEPDNDLPDPRKLDLVERQELAARYAEELKELKDKEAKMKILKSDAEKAAREKERDEQLEALAKKLAEKQKPA